MPGIQVAGNVGPDYAQDGSVLPIRLGRGTEVIVSELNARYAENAIRGNNFIAHNVAAVTLSVALATTYTGLCITNPPVLAGTPAKNLVILGCGFALSVAPAGIASLHLIAGSVTTTPVAQTTPLAAPGIQNALIGSGAKSSALAASAATIVNPGYVLPLMGGFTAAALPASPASWIDISGGIVVPPGSWIAIGALTAAVGFGAISWCEVPV
jgi:hypothetical protein